MKVVCSWCGRDTGEKDGKGIEGVSHGICGECVAKLEARRVANHSTLPRFNILIQYLAKHITLN
jgi:hypothetical protein